jgi:hypothetical protein
VIAGRPSNLWLGASTAVFNVLVFTALAYNIVIPADLIAAVNIALAAVIALVSVQPPTVNTGDKVTVKTANGGPDKSVTFTDTGTVATNVNKS